MGNTLALPAPKLTDEVYCMDALAFLRCLPEASVDMILADLPYGTTNCAWDTVIPFEPMWAAFKRVIKSRGAIVLTASQPFTSKLVCSNLEMFKYSWVWKKSRVTNVGNAKNQPLRITEDILVFNAPRYFPQGLKPFNRIVNKGVKAGGQSNRGGLNKGFDYFQEWTNYPTNFIETSSVFDVIHPTQKPVALFEYLIRTYTRPGDRVIDPTCGSGTTAIAARNTGRHWIVNDYDPHWCDVTRERLAQPYTLALPLPIDDAPAPVQAALWEA